MQFAQALGHYLYPRHTNNFKARLIHSTSIIVIAISLIIYQVTLQAFPATGLRVLGYAANISPTEVIRLTNEKRAEAGVLALTYNSSLEAAAKAKGEHMLANDYWAHVAPDGTEPWKFFVDAGYKYRYAGENLARDFSNPQSAVDAWMASPSHRDNLLSSKYNEIGVAVVEGDLGGVDATIIVQLFGKQLVDTIPQTPIAQAQAATEVTPTPTLAITPTPTLSPTPTQVSAPIAEVSPFPTGNQISELPSAGEEEASGFGVLISPFNTTKTVSLVTIVSLLTVMMIDGYVAWRKRTPRIGGKTLAHMAFLGMVLAVVLIAKAGQIL
jgi:uncharacterized protein YkwD